MGNAMITTEKFNKLQMDINFLSKPQIATLCPQELVQKMSEILFDYQKNILNGDYLTLQNFLARMHQDGAVRPFDPVPGRRSHPTLLVDATEEGRHLLLDRSLQHQLRAQAAELREPIGIIEAIEQHLFDGFLDLETWGYPSIHGVVLLGELPKVRFGAYAVFTFPAISGRHPATEM